MFKTVAIILAGILSTVRLIAEPISIHIESRRDYEVLDKFFRMGISEEEYGYVLMGLKPISVRNFYSLDSFPITKDLQHAEKELINVLLVRESIPIWNRLCSQQKNFVLKAVPLEDPDSTVSGWEVQFINISKLQEVIDTNIHLFRYILGPATKTEQLLHQIAYSGEQLYDILHNDLVLVGIILGFGSHNSLVGGRLETITAQSISKDCAPFASKGALLMHHQENHRYYGSYYLEYAGGDDSLFRSHFLPLQPSSGFVNIKNEQIALETMSDPLPVSLQKRPGFVFGAFKEGPSNRPFFKRLQQVQKELEALLKKPTLLEQILGKIGGKKPLITCDQSIFSNSSLLRSSLKIPEWSQVLQKAASHFEDKEEKSAFIDAFSHPTSSSRVAPKMMGVSQATLRGLKKALSNLAAANTHFETLSSDNSLQMIVSNQIYFKTLVEGSGKELKEADRVRIGYVIEDREGNILFANHDVWLSLSQTIPGFAHGVQGMHVGEKRKLFIHPALAYGVLTTLPPCSELMITVHLLDIDDKVSSTLTPLELLDLSWIQDPAFYRNIEESIEQKPRFIGSFYRDLLDKMQDLDMTAILKTVCGESEEAFDTISPKK